MYTDYHAKFYAHALTRRSSSDDPDKLGASLMNATVDLNPHQIDAAMFAFRSPLSRGAILADEVGLGKTIEAGLIISQLWAERKRRILIIVPTTLRKQWVEELADKFSLDAEVFDSKRYNAAVKAGSPNPFMDTSRIIICSYNFARFAQEAIATTLWDLVVIDEAHRLRNVLKSGNKIARAIKESIGQAKGKILLTATPLQNTLLELYALTGFLDEHLFGDLESFKAQYLRGPLSSASAQIYKEWTTRHEGEATVSGRKDVDIRAALIEHFRDRVSIMIATEAAAEGVNLQFCSLVVNYDLPWNPQRIEQRIGRCHRYGQKYDVVVINFLNRANEADLRVFQILRDKFKLFDGVFGASDEVLGALESGVDFERRVAEIYQSCRSAADIDAAFNQLQQELGEEIQNRMSATRATLLEHFDEEVHQRLELRLKSMEERLDRFHRWLWQLTRHELRDAARFQEEGHRFFVPDKIPGFPAAPTGSYRLVTRERVTDGFQPYRLGHDLAQHLVGLSRDRALTPSLIRFDYSRHSKGRKISDVERLRGKHGWLALTKVGIEALQQQEDYLIFAAVTSDGAAVESEACEKLFEVPGDVIASGQIDSGVESHLDSLSESRTKELMARLADRNQRFFVEEIDKLDRWAEDRKRGLEQELKVIKAEITALKRTARMQGTLEEKVALQRKVKELEAQLTRKRRELFEAEDEIDRQKEELISNVEARLSQNVSSERLFVVEWEVQ